jgi:hypothetical protein
MRAGPMPRDGRLPEQIAYRRTLVHFNVLLGEAIVVRRVA